MGDKLLIAGSRSFRNYLFLEKEVNDYIIGRLDVIEIVSGGQVTTDADTGEKYGADYLGEQYAKKFGFKVRRFPADWATYGRKGGFIRNKEMAEYVSHAKIFWDGQTKGTQMMIRLLREQGIEPSITMFKH